jgi:hypothetical protein
MNTDNLPILETYLDKVAQSGAAAESLTDAAPEEAVSVLRRALTQDMDAPFRGQELDEIHLRFLSNAALAARLVKGEERPSWITPLNELLSGRQILLPPVYTHACGLSHLRLDRCLVLQFPSETRCPEPEPIINALNSLTSSNDGIQHWVLDMSACLSLKPSLLAYLLGFQHSLRDSSHIVMLWLRQDAVPEALMPSVRKSFKVENRGAFLLTMPSKPA